MKTRARLQAELRRLQALNNHGWKNYELERRMNKILERRNAALQARLAKFEHSLECQQ